jgi:hypothetical protein
MERSEIGAVSMRTRNPDYAALQRLRLLACNGRLRFKNLVKYRHDEPAKLDYGLPFARNVGCL